MFVREIVLYASVGVLSFNRFGTLGAIGHSWLESEVLVMHRPTIHFEEGRRDAVWSTETAFSAYLS